MSRPLALAQALLLTSTILSSATRARADGSFPEPQRILLRVDRPEQIILATNFGLVLSEDAGATWLFSCEQPLSAYAGQYLLGGSGSHRIFALTGNGLVYSDDDSCTWSAAAGTLSDVVPYALAVDPSSDRRVYAIGVPRDDRRAGESIYVSDDGGATFGEPVFTAPGYSALLTVAVAPSQPLRLFATMFAAPENHPILLRSDDAGARWAVVANLVASLGNSPFELLAIDPLDADKLYARVLGASAETLAVSDDGGLSFVQSASIPGKLKAFLKLASGTILVGGVAGSEAVGYRSHDGARTFEPWPEAPHVHALAERNGKLYVAGEHFWDGFAIAESDDEGASLRPLVGFNQIDGVKSCAANVCAESCAYYAGIDLWPESVCAGAQTGTSPDEPAPDGEPTPPAAAEPHRAGESAGRTSLGSTGGCACGVIDRRSPGIGPWLLLGILMLGAGRRRLRPPSHRKGGFGPKPALAATCVSDSAAA